MAAPALGLVLTATPALDVAVGRVVDDGQSSLPLASEGVQRWAWQSRFGPILIEVVGDDVFVNGQRVQPHVA